MKRLILSLLCAFTTGNFAADRVALVIGINAYPNLSESAACLTEE
jgi:hypothetical protein